MTIRLRVALFIVAAAGALAVAVISALRLLVPDLLGVLGDLPPGLIGMLAGELSETAVGLAGGLGVLAVVLMVRATRAEDAPDPETTDAVPHRASRARRRLRAAALLAALLVAVTTPGGMIPVAGYAFALAVLAGVVVLVVLLTLRRPWAGLLIAAAIAGIVSWAVLRRDGAELIGRILAAFAPVVPTAVVALAHLGAAAALVAWTVLDARRDRGGIAVRVRRHRRAITIAAALCAVPYVVARASWLTPWPLLGGTAEMFETEPMMQLTGLMLGIGMLAAGVLTLGLALPWGERFPRWMAGLGGREVPVALAVVPAMLVAVLFTVGGVEFVVAVAAQPAAAGNALEMMLMLPFWLWGPLLALAAWGYAMRGDSRRVIVRA